MRPQDAPRDLSGADGRPDSLGAPGGLHRAGLSHGRLQGRAHDQPHPLSAAMDDLLCEVESVRCFAGVNPEKVPDETTVKTSAANWRTWPSGGDLLKEGSIVDATIISAPSSTKNESNVRDPEMHRTRKGNRRHFEMKLHIGTNPQGLVHHLEGTFTT